MKKLLCLTLLLGGLCASFGVQAEIYRWIDKNGKVNYADKEPLDAEAQARRLYDSRIEQETLPYATRQAAARFPLTLITGPECKEPCTLAREYLSKRKLPFAEKSLVSKEEVDAMKQQLGKAELAVPTLLIGSRLLEGFEAGRWGSELGSAGYPK